MILVICIVLHVNHIKASNISYIGIYIFSGIIALGSLTWIIIFKFVFGPVRSQVVAPRNVAAAPTALHTNNEVLHVAHESVLVDEDHNIAIGKNEHDHKEYVVVVHP